VKRYHTNIKLSLPTLLAALTTLIAGGTPARGADEPPQLQAVAVAQAPTIDGVLDDPCWQQATRVEGFWREDVDAPEPERTEAWICQDERGIYVAFRCHDSTPENIRAAQRKRQGSMWRDDHVGLWLDVENAGRSFYGFTVNPLGTQSDRVPGGSSEKIEWRGDWRAAARVDAEGWTAEIAVPFSILRYPQGQTAFRFYLARHLAWENDTVLWPPLYARIRDSENCARWVGVVAPPVPVRYALMPYLLSVASENPEEREPLKGGLDAKATLPSGVVGLLTYNPDFSNIEDVVETIDFTFVERYLPEYRPFFQTGGEYLPTAADEWERGPVELLYTRRISLLDWGAKSFGTVGPHRFGVLDAYHGGGENHAAWRYEYLFGTRGRLGFAGADRRVPGEPDNLAMSFGGAWGWPFSGGSRSVSANWYRSRTDVSDGEDSAVNLSASVWRSQGWSGWLGYSAVGVGFRADDGYVPEVGVRTFSAGWSHNRTYDTSALQQAQWWGSFEVGDSQAGERHSVWVSHDRDWRNGWSAEANVSRGVRDGFDVISNGLEIGWNRQDIYRRGKMAVHWGERYDEPYRYHRIEQSFCPAYRWSVGIAGERVYAAELDEETGAIEPPAWIRQIVLTTSYDLTDEKTVSARLVRRAAATNVYAAYRQRVRRGMDLLVVVGDPNAEEWVSRLAVKAIWCF